MPVSDRYGPILTMRPEQLVVMDVRKPMWSDGCLHIAPLGYSGELILSPRVLGLMVEAGVRHGLLILDGTLSYVKYTGGGKHYVKVVQEGNET